MYILYVLCKGRNADLYIKPNLGTVYMGDSLELECISTSGANDTSEVNEISWAKINDDMENNVEYLKSILKYVILSTDFCHVIEKDLLTT